jgi:hypothetical protein
MFLGVLGGLFGGDWTRLMMQAPPPASEALLAEFRPADCRTAQCQPATIAPMVLPACIV